MALVRHVAQPSFRPEPPEAIDLTGRFDQEHRTDYYQRTAKKGARPTRKEQPTIGALLRR
jgi:hypothetical protein